MSDLTRFRDHCHRRATTDTELPNRILWAMLADEVDAYLTGPVLPSDADHDPIDYDDPIDEYRKTHRR